MLTEKPELHLLALHIPFVLISHFQSNQGEMALLVKALLDSSSNGAVCQPVHLLVSTGDALQSMTEQQQGSDEPIALISRATTPVKGFLVSIGAPLSCNRGGGGVPTPANIRDYCLSKLAKTDFWRKSRKCFAANQSA